MKDPIVYDYLNQQANAKDRAAREFGRSLQGSRSKTLQEVSPGKYKDTRPSIRDFSKQVANDKAKNFVAAGHTPADLVVIRHGATEQTDKKDVSAPLDGPLDAKGQKEAERLAAELNAQNLSGLITSPMQRTQETAAIISKKTGVPILNTLAGLAPWDRGPFTGHTEADSKIRDTFAKHFPDKEVVPGTETFNQYKNRLLNTVKNIQKGYPNHKIGLVMHSSGNKTVAAWEKKGMPENNDIDMKTFLEDGMKPGQFRKVSTPKMVR